MKKLTSVVLCLSVLCVSLAALADDKVAKEKIDSTLKLKKEPLVEDIVFSKNDFSMDVSAGLSNVTGNTRSLSLNAENTTNYRIHRFQNLLNAGAFYSRIFSSNKSDITPGTDVKFLYGTYRLDYYLTQRWTWFVGGGSYSDQGKGVHVGARAFTGAQFIAIRRPSTLLTFSLGYNYTYEDRYSPNASQNLHQAMQQIYFMQKLNDRLKFTQTFEALEDVRDANKTMINTNTSLRVSITKHLGTSIGFKIRFDNSPASGFDKLDTFTDFNLSVVF